MSIYPEPASPLRFRKRPGRDTLGSTMSGQR
jgi:hypothetical protein